METRKNLKSKTMNAMKNLSFLAPKWWNPLFWMVVILAPIVSTILFTIGGAFTGMLVGYERGLDFAHRKLNRIISQLP